MIQSRVKNELGGVDVSSYHYKDLTDKYDIVETKHYCLTNGVLYYPVEKYVFHYDNQKRLLARDYYLNSALLNKVENEFNTLGDKIIKKRFYDSQNVLKRSVKYNYNIRGWLTQINDPENYSTDDLFALKLYYNEDISINEPRHNGNISFAKWQSSCPSGDCDPVFQGLKGYSYSYDKLNRLTDAVYYKGANMDRTATYNESVTAYDRNGIFRVCEEMGWFLPKQPSIIWFTAMMETRL